MAVGSAVDAVFITAAVFIMAVGFMETDSTGTGTGSTTAGGGAPGGGQGIGDGDGVILTGATPIMATMGTPTMAMGITEVIRVIARPMLPSGDGQAKQNQRPRRPDGPRLLYPGRTMARLFSVSWIETC